MILVKTVMTKTRAYLHYRLGAFIFYSSLGSLNEKLHHYGVLSLRRAADIGNDKAAFLLGLRLKYRGKNNAYQALGIEYLRKAASNGDCQPQFMLAEALNESALNHKVDSEILSLYEKSANQGHKMAALRLSKAYEQGMFGLTINQKKADDWSQKFLADSEL